MSTCSVQTAVLNTEEYQKEEENEHLASELMTMLACVGSERLAGGSSDRQRREPGPNRIDNDNRQDY